MDGSLPACNDWAILDANQHAYVLVKRYGPLHGLKCRNLLKVESEKIFVDRALDGEAFDDPDRDKWMPFIYGFIIYALRQYLYTHDAQLKAAPRLKSLLAQRNTVTKLRGFVDKYINTRRDMDVEWKKPGLTFLESLPDLP